MASQLLQLLTLSWSLAVLLTLNPSALTLGNAAIGWNCTQPDSCNGTYTCAPAVALNLSVNISFEQTETQQLPHTTTIHHAAMQLSWQPPPVATGGIGYKLCMATYGSATGCPFIDVVQQLPENTTQYELVDLGGHIRFQCPYILQVEYLSAKGSCQGCATMTIPYLVIDLYEKDPVIFVNVSHTPNTSNGWYQLVVNLSLPQGLSPFLVEGAPFVEVEWSQVSQDLACPIQSIRPKNRIAVFNTMDLIGMWGTASVSLPPLIPATQLYEVVVQAIKSNTSSLYKHPSKVCHSFTAPVLTPAPVEGVWAEVGIVSFRQLNATIGWESGVASYGQLERFEVDVIIKNRVGADKNHVYQVVAGLSEWSVSLQLPNSLDQVLVRVRAVNDNGFGNWSLEVVVYNSTLQPPAAEAESPTSLVAIIATVVPVSVVAVCVLVHVVAALVIRAYTRSTTQAGRWLWRDLTRMHMPECSVDLPIFGDSLEVDPSEVVCDEEMGCIGDGNFARVWFGTFRGQAVAIKAMKCGVGYSVLSAFRKEIQMMKKVTVGNCAHVVNLLAACSLTDPMLIVMELAAFGSLLDYLQRTRSHACLQQEVPYCNLVSVGEMMNFATQIAKGMHHLASQRVIHRDLACRNCLLSDNGLVKVADFGLSRTATLYSQSSPGHVPLRWMAPESISKNCFTTKSDVWSFGVAVWEIYTLGEFPYMSLDNSDILPELMYGIRLPRPARCSEPMYALLNCCWIQEPQHRPSFSSLVQELEGMEQMNKRGTPIAEESDGLESGAVQNQVGEQEECRDILTQTLAQLRERLSVIEEESEEESGDDCPISIYVQDYDAEDYVSISGSVLEITLTVEVMEDGAMQKDGRGCSIKSHGQDGEQEGIPAPPSAQVHIKEPLEKDEGDVALLSPGQDYEQEEYVSISEQDPCSDGGTYTASATVKVHFHSPLHSD